MVVSPEEASHVWVDVEIDKLVVKLASDNAKCVYGNLSSATRRVYLTRS